MACDNDCTRSGWIEYNSIGGIYDIHISVAPDTDMDSTFLAFDHDEQEMVRLNGWLFIFEMIKES